jgi:hypothetical protein
VHKFLQANKKKRCEDVVRFSGPPIEDVFASNLSDEQAPAVTETRCET